MELINAFVDNSERRKGVGRALVTAIEEHVKGKGYKEFILISGPRYQFSGWAAWTKIFGPPIATARDYFGEGYHAQVWRKAL